MSKFKTTSQNAKLIISLSIILLTSFLIRLISLNQSLWLDEATTARVVQQFNFYGIITKFSPTDFHPPLYYLFMKIWTNIFGYSEISLRMPSVLFSLLTGYLIYLIGKKLFNNDSGLASLARMTKGQQFGLWTAVFFLFNPLIVYYSQEARMYMMATFLLTVSLYYLLTSLRVNEFKERSKVKIQKLKLQLKSQNWKSILLFNVFISLSLLTFYGSIFLIIPMGFYLLYKKRFSVFFTFLLLFTVTLLLLYPLLYQQIINAKQQLQLVPNWGQALGKANLKNLILIPLKFSIGRISFEPKVFYYLISGIWTLFIFGSVIKAGLNNNSKQKSKLLEYLLFSPIVLGLFFSFFTPLLQYFRFLYLIPIMSILLALGSAKFHRFGGIWLVLTGFILFSMTYLLNPQFLREDWKSLTKTLRTNRKIYMVYSSSDPILYYRKDLQIIDLKSILDLQCLDSEIIAIPYSSDIHGIDYQKILSERNYKLVKKQSFRGLIVETWSYYNSM